MVHDLVTASVEPHVVEDCPKSPKFAPPKPIELMETVLPPLFVSVTFFAGEVAPVTCPPNASDEGETDRLPTTETVIVAEPVIAAFTVSVAAIV
jgi:hypothetical protein